MAKPNEYNKTILFLASEASSYMTGSVIIVMVEEQLFNFLQI